jgi:hypothetical protein
MPSVTTDLALRSLSEKGSYECPPPHATPPAIELVFLRLKEIEMLNDQERLTVPAGIFGYHFGTRIEPDVYAMASRLSPDYRGGYWEFYKTKQGAFFMAPSDKGPFLVCSNNGYEGYMSCLLYTSPSPRDES